MATREHYLDRAARLRTALEEVNDPLARRILVAVIEALEEAAAEAEPEDDEDEPLPH